MATQLAECPACGGVTLPVLLDDKSLVLVDAMPSLGGEIFARDYGKGWRGYYAPLEYVPVAPPHHVMFAQHVCPEPGSGST